MLSPTRIGIIGAGASAVCLLSALRERSETPEAVTVFDPSAHLWRGRAYQPDAATLLVNAPPEDMTVRAGDPEHFIRWLGARRSGLAARSHYDDPWAGIAFAPRALYGDYLEQCAREALAALHARGCEVRLVRRAVTEVARDGERLAVRTDDGAVYPFDHTVLCVGNAGPADPHQLAGTPGFVADPYPVVNRLADVDPDARVLVVGNGLTAVDMVLTLTARGHRGGVVLASRRGVLPSVRQRPVEHRARYFTAERFRAMAARGESLTLARAVALMADELAAVGSSSEVVAREITAAGTEDPLARLRRQFEAVNAGDPGLRVLQRAVPDTGPDVWTLLPERDRAEVLHRHYRTLMSLCCPMPPTSAAVLLGEADAGRLGFARGLTKIVPDPTGGFGVRTADGWQRADVVVNAVSPPGHRVPAAARPLVDSLTARGLAELHPRGGLRVARATSGVLADGVPDPRIFALGELASGSLLFTFGVPSLLDRALDIVEAIHLDTARRAESMQVV
ncbi:FAD/NAD(P)-binding protein [Streptomyces sp. NBRC 109706]|uniref:FAD/NAD(P)-binding protein n=1 Tax=Streptomyces sp. NBRC 109706 TaxID=1550035 RepID=UPI00099C9BCA|nr:FAD/NAD(P)-binding protein [Streptomyces sp. NBRC 109706]